MSNRLSNKTALLRADRTASARRSPQRFASEGADLGITYAGNKAATAGAVAAIQALAGPALATKANPADPEAVRSAIGHGTTFLGGIDILVHNAGITETVPVPAATAESYRK